MIRNDYHYFIKEVYHSFFKTKGFVLDDAYDPYKLKLYVHYYIEHNIAYIRCQDVALENLNSFKDVSYLTIPKEAENFSELTKLTNLKGLELSGTQLGLIPESISRHLQSAVIYCYNEKVDGISAWKKLENVKLDGFPGVNYIDLHFIKDLRIKDLSISSSKIITLDGIECQTELNTLELWQCSKLSNISSIANLKSLKRLRISECNKVSVSSLFFLPESIESLSILGSESTAPRSRFSSLDFLLKFNNLKEFETNWRVDSTQLEVMRKTVPRIVIY